MWGASREEKVLVQEKVLLSGGQDRCRRKIGPSFGRLKSAFDDGEKHHWENKYDRRSQ